MTIPTKIEQYIPGTAFHATRRGEGRDVAGPTPKRYHKRFAPAIAALAFVVAMASASGGPLQTLKRPLNERIFCLAFAPDGKHLAVGSSAPAAQTDRLREGVTEFYDLSTGKLTRTFRHSAWSENSDSANAVGDIAFSPDGKLVLVADGLGYVLYDVATWRQKASWRGMSGSPSWSADGKRLALPWKPIDSSRIGMAVIEVSTGNELAFLPVDNIGDIRTARFSPDGRFVATAGADCVVRVFEVNTKTEIFKDNTKGTLFAACFSPDGRELVAGSSWSGVLLLYDVAVQGGKAAVKKKGQSSPTGQEIYRVEYHPDGKHAVTLSPDGVRVWDTGDWRKAVRKEGVLGWLSADGTKVAVVKGESPTEIELWRFEDLIKGL